MPQAQGPCSRAKYQAWLFSSLLIMKLISPWRHRVTSLERCRATSVKPSSENASSSTPGTGEANSTNSKPSSPMGFSKRSAIAQSSGLFCCTHLFDIMSEFSKKGVQTAPVNLKKRNKYFKIYKKRSILLNEINKHRSSPPR